MWILHEPTSELLKECNLLDLVSAQQSWYGAMLVLSINQKNLRTIDSPSLPGPIVVLHHWMMDFASINISPSLQLFLHKLRLFWCMFLHHHFLPFHEQPVWNFTYIEFYTTCASCSTNRTFVHFCIDMCNFLIK